MGLRPTRLGGLHPLQHAPRAEVAAVHAPEDIVVQGVQGDRYPPQPRVLQGSGLVGQQVGVGRHRQVVYAVDLRDHAHQALDVVAHQRLAAGQTHLHGALPDHDPDQPGDLLEGQQVGPGEELVPVAVYLGGHAVGAPEVAPVGHGDPQVPEGPVHCVGYHHASRHLPLKMLRVPPLPAPVPPWPFEPPSSCG